MTNQRPDVVLPLEQYEQLQKLVDNNPGPNSTLLEEELERAKIVDDNAVPAGVAVMNSKIVFVDVDTNEENNIELVYPQDADPDRARVSVLAPIGTALLGLKAGSSIDWPMPGGRTRRLMVKTVS